MNYDTRDPKHLTENSSDYEKNAALVSMLDEGLRLTIEVLNEQIRKLENRINNSEYSLFKDMDDLNDLYTQLSKFELEASQTSYQTFRKRFGKSVEQYDLERQEAVKNNLMLAQGINPTLKPFYVIAFSNDEYALNTIMRFLNERDLFRTSLHVDTYKDAELKIDIHRLAATDVEPNYTLPSFAYELTIMQKAIEGFSNGYNAMSDSLGKDTWIKEGYTDGSLVYKH